MPAPRRLNKAELREIRWNVNQNAVEINRDRWVEVQFNPETLSVNFSNQKAGGDQRGGSAIQFVGQGTTKLSMELWFDATVSDTETDVRKLTEKVNYFIKPRKTGTGRDAKWIAPGVRVVWGSFLFDGIMDSFSEKLEFFSEDGIPLRARGAVAISSQFIQFEFGQQVAATAEDLPGTLALQAARSRDSVQRVMQRASSATGGRQATWQQVAALNGIENPRRLSPGTLLDSGISINRRTISSEFGIDINLDDDR